MKQQELQEWLINFFSEKAVFLDYDNEERLSCNYIEAGFIDSFGVINLVTNLEKEFSIKLSNDVFQDRRFVTISGLSELISEL